MPTMTSLQQGHGNHRVPYPNPLPLRVVSLALAVALSALILVYPRAIASSVSDIRHGLLSMMMWGIAAGFVHGVGFVPRLLSWRILFHPFTGWLLMAMGIAWLLTHR